MKSLIRPNILNLAPYSSARDEYKDADGIFLDANENPYGTQNRYPDPYQKSLKSKISEIKNVPPKNIFLGNGSDEIIDIAFRIFCEPGQDKALTFTPTYGMYQVSADINNVVLIKVPLDKNFQIDLKTTLPFLEDENLKLIFICSPNNPTGNLIDAYFVEYILNHFKGIVIIDEAYIDFCNEPSFSQRLNEFPNLIVCQTLSKAWAMAGVRLGIAFMSEAILSFYNKVKAPYNISGLNQDFVQEKLGEITEFELRKAEILEEKASMIEDLNDLDFVKYVYPSDANFLLVEVEDANAIYQKLIEAKIIIRNRNSIVPNCVRITIGKPFENNLLIETLRGF